MDYLDFELEIGLGSDRDYTVTVIHSPAGEARAAMRFPFDKLELENNLLKLQNALLRSGGQRRAYLAPERQSVQDFGSAMFEALFTGEVRSRYDLSLERARRDDKGLRLKLRIQPPELATLPWEFLFDPRQADYICLYSLTPVVRYLELPQIIQPLAITPPLRILGMIASPNGLPPLNVERERQRIEMALADLRSRHLVELTWLPGQSGHDLQRAMRHGPWHVFHFIGHGGFDRSADEGFIAVADTDGEASHLKATDLGRLLGDHPPLRMALLSACEGARAGDRDIFSSTAATLLRRGVPAVVAMQYEVTDEAAIEFARAFYEALADAVPVDAAVSEARKAISRIVSSTLEWGTPVLFMHSPDGVLFNIQQSSAVAAQRHDPAGLAEQSRMASAQPIRRDEADMEPEQSRSMPVQSNMRGVTRMLLAGGALLVLAAVLGMLFMLPGLFRAGASTGTPTAAGEAVSASFSPHTTPELILIRQTIATESPLAFTATSLPEPTALTPGFVRLEETIFIRFDPNVPGDSRLDAGRLYRLTAAKPIGRYCQIEIPPDGMVWALCSNVGAPEPQTATPRPTPTPKPMPPSTAAPASAPAPSLTAAPTSAPARISAPVSTFTPFTPEPTLTPTSTTPTSVTYRVNIIRLALDKIKALPGCGSPTLSNNACIVGPSNLNMALDSLNTNQVFPFSSDVRLITIFPTQTRIRVVSDSSGLPVTTIGNNEFVPEVGQYYEVSVEKVG